MKWDSAGKAAWKLFSSLIALLCILKTLKNAVVSFIMSLCYCIRNVAAKIFLNLANVQLVSFLFSWEIFLQTAFSRLLILSCRLTHCKDFCPTITEKPFLNVYIALHQVAATRSTTTICRYPILETAVGMYLKIA